MKFCEVCYHELDDAAVFCPNCGEVCRIKEKTYPMWDDEDNKNHSGEDDGMDVTDTPETQDAEPPVENENEYIPFRDDSNDEDGVYASDTSETQDEELSVEGNVEYIPFRDDSDDEEFEQADIEELLDKARSYYIGEEGDENCYKAFSCYKNCVEIDPDNSKANNGLGKCYAGGIGTKRDRSKAMEYYRKAAMEGLTEAQYNLALELARKQDPEAVDWYIKAFENGDLDAPLKLAVIYREGALVACDDEKALEYFRKAVELGNTEAMVNLALMYLRGDAVKQDVDEGLSLMEKAAENGNSAAANNMSVFYCDGEYVQKNIDMSISWAIKAMELGDCDQLLQYAFEYLEGSDDLKQDKEEAFRIFTRCAENGDMEGMEEVAFCYLNAEGTDKDQDKGIEWFEKAAKLGSQKGFGNLRDLYCDKYGEQSGEQKWFDLLNEVADDGYFSAMVILANCYLDGDGVEQDISKGMSFLDRAVEGEYGDACVSKGLYLFRGEYGLTEDMKEGIRLWEIAADQDNPVACHNLGVCYKEGDGVEQDSTRAIDYFTRAMELGYTDAILQLGYMYYDGEIVEKDDKKAFDYYEKAYSEGSIQGAYCLGIMYAYGKGVEQDLVKALELYEYAAENDHALAARQAGLFYKEGKGVEANAEKANEFFRRAADLGDDKARILLNGENILSADISELMEIYDKGDRSVAFFIGSAYLQGQKGASKDISKAIQFLTISADENSISMNSHRAMIMLADIYYEGKDIPVDYERAFMYAKRSFDLQPTDFAIYLMTMMYAYGKGVEKDREKVKELCEEAINRGINEIWPYRFMAQSLLIGTVSDDDMVKAYNCLCKVIEMDPDDPYANDLFAKFYKTGIKTKEFVVEQNINKAVECFKKVNTPEALMELGDIFSKEEYGLFDPEKAISYYKQSRSNGNINAAAGIVGLQLSTDFAGRPWRDEKMGVYYGLDYLNNGDNMPLKGMVLLFVDMYLANCFTSGIDKAYALNQYENMSRNMKNYKLSFADNKTEAIIRQVLPRIVQGAWQKILEQTQDDNEAFNKSINYLSGIDSVMESDSVIKQACKDEVGRIYCIIGKYYIDTAGNDQTKLYTAKRQLENSAYYGNTEAVALLGRFKTTMLGKLVFK